MKYQRSELRLFFELNKLSCAVVRIVFLLVYLTSCIRSEEPLTVTFTGDVILDRGVSDELTIYGDSILNKSFYPFLQSDFNIINLETVLTNESESAKSGYTLRYGPSITKNLSSGAVTHASIANNHSYDFDSVGYFNTLLALESSGIVNLGSTCESNILSKDDQSFAIIAASLTSNSEHLCVSDVNTLLVMVREFQVKYPEIPLILYLHWGLEYQRAPEKWQTHWAHVFIDHGADGIIGHHPHVAQSIEYYNDKPIVYSLGNFLADAYLPNTTYGLTATLTFHGTTPKLSLMPVDLTSYFPVKMEHKDQLKFLLDNLKYHEEMCYYNLDNQWFIRNIEEVDFNEKATEWLFHYENQFQVVIKKMTSGSHKLILYRNGEPQKSLALHGKLSEIDFGDINNDGDLEILLGISKKVNFDRKKSKRLNIFKVEDDGIKVVWLGTQFLYDLQSYEIVQERHTNYLQTIERDTHNKLHKGRYEWDEFGFALTTITPIYESN